MRLPPNAKKWQSIAVVAKHSNSFYALAAAPRQPLETIRAPSYGYDLAGNLVARTNHTLIQSFTPDNANALVNITRNNDLLTVAGSVNQLTTNLTINGEPATFYSDKTFAVTNGVAITNGLNILTAVVNGTMTNRTPRADAGERHPPERPEWQPDLGRHEGV